MFSLHTDTAECKVFQEGATVTPGRLYQLGTYLRSGSLQSNGGPDKQILPNLQNPDKQVVELHMFPTWNREKKWLLEVGTISQTEKNERGAPERSQVFQFPLVRFLHQDLGCKFQLERPSTVTPNLRNSVGESLQ